MKRLAYVIAALCVLAPAQAQQFPVKVVRIINAQGPGTLDVLSRGYAQELTRYWGQPVIVEARAGAGSIVAAEQVAKSAPDGYNILVSSSAAYTINQWITRNMPYDPERDLVPAFGIGRTSSIISAPGSLPAKNVKDLIALARSKPGGLAYGSAGIGSATHLQMEILLKELGDLKMLHVPYKGIADIVRGMLGAEIQLGPTLTHLTIGPAKTGQLRPLFIIGTQREKQLPDVPTLREAGFPNASGSIIWFGFALPSKTPAAIVDKFAADLAKASEEPAMKKALDAVNWDLMLSGPKEFGELWRRERALVGRVVQELGLKPE
jgi:tripartite-type tricarboxylate transporter receptor subunit TctC